MTVGSFDLLDAFVFYWLRYHVTPIRILHSIASGLLGRRAFAGGLATAALGLGLQFFIATGIVITFYLVSRRLRFLTTRPFAYGAMYGLIVYAVMNGIVLPLSAAAHSFPPVLALINGLLIHIFGVGIPTAVFVSAIENPVKASPVAR